MVDIIDKELHAFYERVRREDIKNEFNRLKNCLQLNPSTGQNEVLKKVNL